MNAEASPSGRDYRQLDAGKILDTIDRLSQRIGRFDVENQRSIDDDFSAQVLKYLEELGYKQISRGKK